jgi:hypothetical protein
MGMIRKIEDTTAFMSKLNEAQLAKMMLLEAELAHSEEPVLLGSE